MITALLYGDVMASDASVGLMKHQEVFSEGIYASLNTKHLAAELCHDTKAH